ncbi:Cna B-type domain-containing protein, partial [Vagococcus bubulae]
YEFTNLPKYNQGKLIRYTVTENTVEDYSTTVNGTDLTNRYTPGKTSVTVTKRWNDNQNQDGIRPNAISVQLYADGKESGKPVELNDGNEWTYTWQDLAEKANGTTIKYTVKEINEVSGYATNVLDDNIGNIIITNTHDPEITEIKGEKHWDDANNQDGKRPTSIEVNLLADGKIIDTKTVTEKDNWQYEFTNLPKYNQGKLIRYTVTENAVEDYSTTVSGADLTNHYTPGKTSVTVTKRWDDNQNQDGLRPESIQVQLYADGNESGKPVELNDSNKWQYTWQELDEKANGKTIHYTVKEIEKVPDYSMSVSDNDKGNIIITNTHTPEMTQVKGEKHWDDANNQDGKRPTSIEVNLLANGKVIETKAVTEKDNWKYDFTNLPKYESGKEINYTVTENIVSGYSTSIDGTDITNHYTPGKTSVTVTKRWEDNQNKNNTRPTSIKVQLYADGKKSGKAVELNEDNHWTYTWDKLAEKANGKSINYTVEEITDVPGYTTSVNDTNIGNIIITNTLNDESRDNVPNTGGNNNSSNGQSNNNSNSQNKLPSTGEKSDVMLFISGLVVLMVSAIVVWYVKQHSVTE